MSNKMFKNYRATDHMIVVFKVITEVTVLLYSIVQMQVYTREHFILSSLRSIRTQITSQVVSTCLSFSHGNFLSDLLMKR